MKGKEHDGEAEAVAALPVYNPYQEYSHEFNEAERNLGRAGKCTPATW